VNAENVLRRNMHAKRLCYVPVINVLGLKFDRLALAFIGAIVNPRFLMYLPPCNMLSSCWWALHSGGGVRVGGRRGGGYGPPLALAPGRAVQVDPMKPKLKAPGSERLKLNCNDCLHILLSNSTCAATSWSPVRGW